MTKPDAQDSLALLGVLAKLWLREDREAWAQVTEHLTIDDYRGALARVSVLIGVVGLDHDPDDPETAVDQLVHLVARMYRVDR